MCEANAYIIRDGEEELLMEAVDTIEPEDDGLRLVNIFGDQKFIHAHIHALFFANHKILLKE
ncbi:MAG: CooT family nickel-binding protein [Deltaproteobacteria bacterium]|jgi:predicted RNA-binding protein|nr:CooT family nickel-binding protein [Deltaproteobacteria bacterium]MBW2566914.1 CooT family nickel-binding protein [Deltaproteobacteria bacterium]